MRTIIDDVNMGHAIFKRWQGLQEGSPAVAEELPTPPLPPEAYQSPAVRSLIDQVRQGILPDEALAEIQRNPTSLRSIAAIGGGAMTAASLLSGGEGVKLPKGEIPSPRVFIGKGETLKGTLAENENSVYISHPSAKEQGKIQVTEYRTEDGKLVPVGDSQYDSHGDVQREFRDRNYQSLGGKHVENAFNAIDPESVKDLRILTPEQEAEGFASSLYDPSKTQSNAVPIVPPRETGYRRGTTTVRGYGPTHMFNTYE